MEKSLGKPGNSAQNARLHMSTLANLSVPSSSPLPPANRSCPFSDKNIESAFSSSSAFLRHSASMRLPGQLAFVHSLHFSERHVHVPYECSFSCSHRTSFDSHVPVGILNGQWWAFRSTRRGLNVPGSRRCSRFVPTGTCHPPRGGL